MIWPVVVYGALVLALVTMMLVVSYFLGERHQSPERNEPYESGIPPTGSALVRYDVHYYLVGLFFILFDVEAAILFTWAIAFRTVGWAGYVAATLFIVTLGVGLAYVWKLGGLDWYKSRLAGGDRQ